MQQTSEHENRLWRLCKERYGIDAFDLIPEGESADMAGTTTNWSQRSCSNFITIMSCLVFKNRLDILHFALSSAKYSRLLNERVDPGPKPFWPLDRPQPEHCDFLADLKDAAEMKNSDSRNASQAISVWDLETIKIAWDVNY